MSTVEGGKVWELSGNLVDSIRRIAVEEGVSGVVRVDIEGEVVFEEAFGSSHRGLKVSNATDTLFAIASGTKALTALTVMSLVERNELTLATSARSILGEDLPLIDDRVTVEHLLAHRSGIGDYLDEDEVTDPNEYLMPVPVCELVVTEDYLAILDGHRSKFAPDERFEYCNSGYVVLALIIERVSGSQFHELVEERVCRPAGMTDTAFLRSDELPGRAAIGYLDDQGLRTNVFHLPVRGNGDGGIYTTAADIHTFWNALLDGAIVSPDNVADMIRPRSEDPIRSMRYGLGFWLDASTDTISIHGFDNGVGFVSVHDRPARLTHTVLSNKSRGAWPCSQRLSSLLAGTC